jgi:hypothetical protein
MMIKIIISSRMVILKIIDVILVVVAMKEKEE